MRGMTWKAVLMQLTADIATEDGAIVLRTSGRQLLFDGWLKAWEKPLAGAALSFSDISSEKETDAAEGDSEGAEEASEQSEDSPGNHHGRILQVRCLTTCHCGG